MPTVRREISATACSARYGVETSYFDPLIGAGIAGLFKPNTKAVLVEAPGSQSFEMPDIPAIASVAHARGALVIDDNTWATPLFHRSLEQGVDISMQAATKYIGGHSDIMFGTISANAKAWPLVAEAIQLLGVCAGPDDVFLALRGLRTLAVRLAQHHRSGLEMARTRAKPGASPQSMTASCARDSRITRMPLMGIPLTTRRQAVNTHGGTLSTGPGNIPTCRRMTKKR